jgi:predicted dehydrogenase
VRGQVPPLLEGGGRAPEPRERLVHADRPLFVLEADSFASAVLDGAAPAVSREDSLGNMRVLDELRRQVGVVFGEGDPAA